MNGMQRVQAAIDRRPSLDRIPRGEFLVEKDFVKDFMRTSLEIEKYDPEIEKSNLESEKNDLEIEIEFYRRLGADLVCIFNKNIIDKNTANRGKTTKTSSLTKYCNLTKYCYMKHMKHMKHIKHMKRIKRLKQEGFFVFSVVNGVFQTLMKQRGFMDFLKNIAVQPQQAAKEMRKLSQKLIPLIAREVQAGANGIIIADDIAYNQGTYASPGFIKKFLLPCWQEQVRAAKEIQLRAVEELHANETDESQAHASKESQACEAKGSQAHEAKNPQVNAAKGSQVRVFFHSDGNISAVLPAIVEAGFDGLHCIEPAAGMNIREVKEKYGRNLCLMGNIDPALLTPDTADLRSPGTAGSHNNKYNSNYNNFCFPELAQAVTELISAAAPGGGFIFGTCSGLHAGLSPKKVRFMYELAEKIQYP